MSRSARNEGNKNATGIGFQLQDVTKSMHSRVLNLHLEVRVLFSLHSGHLNLEINIFHIAYTVTFYPFLFHFYISCPDQPGKRKHERNRYGFSFQLQDITQLMDFRVLNMHVEVRELFSLRSGHPNLEINIFLISYTIIFHPFVCYFYVSCSNQAGIRET